MSSLIDLEEPRKTYLRLSSGQALENLQSKIKDKSMSSIIKSEGESMNSTDEKRPTITNQNSNSKNDESFFLIKNIYF